MNTSDANADFFAAPTSAKFCSSHSGNILGEAVPQGGQTGTTDLPQAPGYVIPNGYQVYELAEGLNTSVIANGYLIPSSDAPAMPG